MPLDPVGVISSASVASLGAGGHTNQVHPDLESDIQPTRESAQLVSIDGEASAIPSSSAGGFFKYSEMNMALKSLLTSMSGHPEISVHKTSDLLVLLSIHVQDEAQRQSSFSEVSELLHFQADWSETRAKNGGNGFL